MSYYQFFSSRGPWWMRLLAVMVSMLLLVGLFFFAIFAVIAVALIGASGILFLWWQRRKIRKGMRTDIVVTDYRESHRPPFDNTRS
jgi:hypothetical protein